jgi:two-component system, OmpR family, response regulator VanR
MNNFTNILIVDDDADIRKLIRIYLKNEAFQIFEAENGLEAFDILVKETVDCIIMDIMMPKLDGIQALMKIREERVVPVILLSAKSEDMDKISGLSVGADDYVTKPFNPLELVARVKAQIRRYKQFQMKDERHLYIRNLVIDLKSREVKVNGQEVTMTPREFDILVLLAENPNTVFSSEQIYQSIWKEDSIGSDNTVMVHIRNVREKLEKACGDRFIETVWGVGYKIQC